MDLILLLVSGLVLVPLGILSFGHLLRNTNCRMRSWKSLIEGLTPLKFSVIARIAHAYLNPASKEMDPRICEENSNWSEILEPLGGLWAARAMRRNSMLIVDAAYYVVTLLELAENGYHDAMTARNELEQLGMQQRELTRWVWQLEFWRFLPTRGPWNTFYAERIATLYYMMAERLLTLYKVSHAGLVPDLERALFLPETV